jgi:hypothetical protein
MFNVTISTKKNNIRNVGLLFLNKLFASANAEGVVIPVQYLLKTGMYYHKKKG